MRSSAVRCGVWCLVAVAVAGCSSGEPEPATTEPAATTRAEMATTEVDGSGSAPTSAPGGGEQEEVYVVAIDVAVERLDLSDQLEVAVAGCSSGEPEPATPEPAATTIAETATTAVDASGSAPTSAPGGAEQEEVYVVAIDVAVERLDLSDQLAVAIDPDGLDEIDPFTRFSSCSGLRASVGTFTVTAVDDTAAVRSVSVVTVDRVTGPGIYDADVRVEPASAGAVSALGTVTLDAGLRSGTFEAFEASGEIVSGTFTCDGPSGTPDLMADSDASGGDPVDEGVLRAVEVVALLRRGEEERIVGLTLDTAEVEAAHADCPGVTGGDGPTLVRVEGGPAVGAITTFELAAGQSPSLRMRVGGASYEVADVAIVVDDQGAAGTFSGVSADGIAIDGAFRCA